MKRLLLFLLILLLPSLCFGQSWNDGWHGSLDLAAPGPIGEETPDTGDFTNITANATPGSELITWTDAGWDEDSVTWTFAGGVLTHVTGNTTAVTGTVTGALTVGRTVRVAITGTGGVAIATYTLGGNIGTTIAASGAIAIVDFLTTTVDSEFVITPANLCTVAITNISVKELVDATGDLTVDGNLIARSPATFLGGLSIGVAPWTIKQQRSTTYGLNVLNISNGTYGVGFRVNSNTSLSVVASNGDDFGDLSLNTLNAYAGVSILADTGRCNFGAVSDAYIIRTAANVLSTQALWPTVDDTFYLGKYDDDTPFAWKAVVVKDSTNGKYYAIGTTNGVVLATDLTD